MSTGDNKDPVDTLFSRYRISGTRLAKLIIASPDDRASMLWDWHPKNDNVKRKPYVDYYRPTRTEVRRFHRRDSSEADVRAEAESWRLQAIEPAQHSLANNARALREYIDVYHGRKLVVLVQQSLEAYIGGLRVTARPHLCALDGPHLRWMWLDCTDALDEELANARANVTLLIAARMGLPSTAKAEIVHAISRRIVRPVALPAGFDAAAAAVCEQVHAIWCVFDQEQSPTPVNRGG